MNPKNSKTAALKSLREYESQLVARIARLKADLRAVRHSLELLGGKATEESEGRSPTHRGELTPGPQSIVEAFLKDNPGRFFRPSAAAKGIRSEGYKPKNPNVWSTQVTVSLKRLRDKGIIQSKERADGKRVFGVPADENEGDSG